MKPKTILFFSAILIAITSSVNAQNQEVIIQLLEDYTNPNGRHWEKSTHWVGRKIEDGIYKAEALSSDISAELTFGNKIEQRNCDFENEAEFKLMMLKGKSGNFIGSKFSLRELKGIKHKRNDYSSDDFSLEYYSFFYNNLGDWRIYKGNVSASSTPVSSGNTGVNEQFNTIKLKHSPNATIIYLNGTEIYTINTKYIARLQWKDIVLTCENSKTKIGLDEALFTGYYNVNNNPLTADDIYGLSVSSFEYVEGFAVKSFSESKYRFMDDYGRIKGNALFDDIERNQNRYSLILVKDNRMLGYINYSGDWVIPAEYTEASKSECYEDNDACLKGYFKVKDAEGKEFLVNHEGKVVPLENGKLAGGNTESKVVAIENASTTINTEPSKSKIVEKIKDNDGNSYDVIKIGKQTWTSQNLKVNHFLNGDLIPEAKSDEAWKQAGMNGKPAWCYAKYNSGEILYNWYAVNDKRGLAPTGWHIPSSSDWLTMMKPIGPIDKKEAGHKLKAVTGWDSDGIGSDEYRFNVTIRPTTS